MALASSSLCSVPKSLTPAWPAFLGLAPGTASPFAAESPSVVLAMEPCLLAADSLPLACSGEQLCSAEYAGAKTGRQAGHQDVQCSPMRVISKDRYKAKGQIVSQAMNFDPGRV